MARGYARMGVRRIVALRGDPPKGETRFVPHPDGFASAAELVAGAARGRRLRDRGRRPIRRCIPRRRAPAADIDNLKRKLDAGASMALTQFFFDNEDFLRFRDACATAGITAPIHPGILPVENFAKMVNFAAPLPGLGAGVDAQGLRAGRRRRRRRILLSVAIACEQCDALIGEGVEHLHVYTLNNPDLTFDVCRTLGYVAAPLAFAAEGGGAA